MATTEKTDYSLIGPRQRARARAGSGGGRVVPHRRSAQAHEGADAPPRRARDPRHRDLARCWSRSAASADLVLGQLVVRPVLLCYGVLYGSASDSRWHESGHGTAFQTSWLNDALYQVASFMNMKEPTLWRWSHARHHTDTIIVGRDREILAMRPPDAARLVVNVIGLRDALDVVRQRAPPRRGTTHRRGGDVHPRDRAPPRLPRGARVGGGLRSRSSPLRSSLGTLPAAHVRRAADPLRPLAGALLRASPSTPGWPRTCSITG